MGIVYRLIVLGFACGIAIWLRRRRKLDWSSAILIGTLVAVGVFMLGELIRP